MDYINEEINKKIMDQQQVMVNNANRCKKILLALLHLSIGLEKKNKIGNEKGKVIVKVDNWEPYFIFTITAIDDEIKISISLSEPAKTAYGRDLNASLNEISYLSLDKNEQHQKMVKSMMDDLDHIVDICFQTYEYSIDDLIKFILEFIA